jgi:hypothetical protein
LPYRHFDIDFYHKFFDTFCWAEGMRCAMANKRILLVNPS